MLGIGTGSRASTIRKNVDSSRRLQDHVAVGGGIAGADQADRIRDQRLELDVRQAGHFSALESRKGLVEGLDVILFIVCEKLLRLPDMTDLEIRLQQLEDVEHGRNP